eukprot:scpid89333/ scgid24278/ 
MADYCLSMCRLDEAAEEAASYHKECQATRMARDEADVSRALDAISDLLHPFKEPSEKPSDLVCVSSGCVCSKATAEDLLEAKHHGETAFHEFLQERFQSQTKKFHGPIKKMKLPSFTMRKSSQSRSTKVDVLRADCVLFSWMALIAQSRNMDVRPVLHTGTCMQKNGFFPLFYVHCTFLYV